MRAEAEVAAVPVSAVTEASTPQTGDPSHNIAPIGVFDSGVGGISVLRHLAAELPLERFSYFGDSAHMPYGDKSAEEVLALSRAIVERFVGEGAKALVIACNTATSVAAEELRRAYPGLPIIGEEPALKPAVAAAPHGRVLVMATTATLGLDKFRRLLAACAGAAEILPVACPGLADRIERGNLDAPDLRKLIEYYVGAYRGSVDAVVLGCTHYPFAAHVIRAVLGDVPLYDGGVGTARQLRRRLEAAGLLATGALGTVTFASSREDPAELALYRNFFELRLEEADSHTYDS